VATPTPDLPAPARPTARPASVVEMMWAFNRLSLQGFGGVIAIAQRELVERLGWLTREEFVEMLSMAQVLPGPNVINLSLMIGDRFFGTRGALAALTGMLLVPSLLVLALTASYAQFATHPVVSSALRSMGAVAAGLVTATALKLLVTLRRNPMGRAWCAVFAVLTLVGVGVLRWPMAVAVLGIGSAAIAVAWTRLRAP
jgi:chromate transporter